MKIFFVVSNPTTPKAKALTLEDVWGKYNANTMTQDSCGMVVARGNPETPKKCPIWGDDLPYKSVTVVCREDQEQDVVYWLEYVQGNNCISRRSELSKRKYGKGMIALRSDYQCW
jgi:hypothetical protein